MRSGKPVFPLTVRFADGEEQTVADFTEAEHELEWFDSEDLAEPTQVVDHLGRPVRLVVKALEVVTCELKEPA